MKKIIIRRMQNPDIPEVVNLHLHTLPTLSAKIGFNYLELLYQALMDNPLNHVCLVALENSEIVGCLTITNNLGNTQSSLSGLKFNPRLIWPVLRAIFLGHISLTDLLNRFRFELFINKNFPKPYQTILTFFVKKESQNHGIGTKLFLASLKLIKNNDPLYVDTEDNNIRAQQWYLKHNFKEVKRVYGNIIFKKF